jgi:hypothetical protein
VATGLHGQPPVGPDALQQGQEVHRLQTRPPRHAHRGNPAAASIRAVDRYILRRNMLFAAGTDHKRLRHSVRDVFTRSFISGPRKASRSLPRRRSITFPPESSSTSWLRVFWVDHEDAGSPRTRTRSCRPGRSCFSRPSSEVPSRRWSDRCQTSRLSPPTLRSRSVARSVVSRVA